MKNIAMIFFALVMVLPANGGLNLGTTGGLKDVVVKLNKKID